MEMSPLDRLDDDAIDSDYAAAVWERSEAPVPVAAAPGYAELLGMVLMLTSHVADMESRLHAVESEREVSAASRLSEASSEDASVSQALLSEQRAARSGGG